MSEEQSVRDLYHRLLDAWNRRDADGYAALFFDDGFAVGFDGSLHENPTAMRQELARIFADHPTAAYVSKVRDVRFAHEDVGILRAVAGMVPPGKTDLVAAANAIQTLVAAKRSADWRIVCFQNTPAAFHGRPELASALTEELRGEIKDRSA